VEAEGDVGVLEAEASVLGRDGAACLWIGEHRGPEALAGAAVADDEGPLRIKRTFVAFRGVELVEIGRIGGLVRGCWREIPQCSAEDLDVGEPEVFSPRGHR
jgi:hypothetical protein